MPDDISRLGRADLHIHTTVSDGLASVEAVLDFAAQHRQLDVLAITDHDRLDASLWAHERRHQYPFDTIPGVEVTTCEGHVLGLWVTQPIPRGLSLAETAAAIHEQGGIAILAHPFHFHILDSLWNCRRFLRHPEILLNTGLDAIEAHNAGVITPFSNKLARRLARLLNMSAIASSDAHTLGAIGTGVTRFPGRTAQDLRTALAQRQTIAEGRPWYLSDYLEIGRALRDWKGNPAHEDDPIEMAQTGASSLQQTQPAAGSD